jgi:hypothetical protein
MITPELVRETWQQRREQALHHMATEHEPYNVGVTIRPVFIMPGDPPLPLGRVPDHHIVTFEWRQDGHIYCAQTGECVE